MRPMCRLQDLDSSSPDTTTSASNKNSYSARSAKKKPGTNNCSRAQGQTKYGVEIPLNWACEKGLDQETNTTTYCQDAMTKEIAALLYDGCFEFKPPGFKVLDDYQTEPLKMVYEIKQNLCCKACLVVQGCKEQ